MKVQAIAASIMLVVLAASAEADTNIVSESFDSYVDQAAFEAVWRPDDGDGSSPLGISTGFLVPDLGIGLTPPNDDPPGIQGQAVNVKNDINEYDNDGNSANVPFELVPSPTQSVQFSADIFSDAAGNKRTSVGLRNDDPAGAQNIVELGQYNANADDPTVAGTVFDQPSTSFAYRVVLFDNNTLGAPLVQMPDWQYFQFDPILDTRDGAAQPNPDGLVTPVDIGIGWHRYTATISENEITLELDLFRDGLANSEATEGVGTPGVDSSVTWTVSPVDDDAGDAFDYDPFTSLRIGAPSGVTSINEAVIDNVSLDMVDVAAVASDADFDGSLVVDGNDYLIWQRGFGLGGQIDNSMGDADGSGTVDGLDLADWESQYGGPPPFSASLAAAVPEPTTATLSLLATMGLALLRRNRRRGA